MGVRDLSATRAARVGYLTAPGVVELRREAVPEPEPGGVVVRVRVALTDGTDLKAYRRGHREMPFPSRFGHEFSGDVEAVGAGVTAFVPGDPVMCVHSAPDGTCWWCLRGEEELCESVMRTKILGAYADLIAVPPHIVAQNMYRKPAGISYVAAAFLEPVACVVHAQRSLDGVPEDTVAVLGDGGFGILHALVARAGGQRPLLIGRNDRRLALARSLGLETVDLRTTAPRDALDARTEGRGADGVIDCTGARDVWESAPGLARRGGAVVLFGGLPAGERPSFDAARLHYDEVRLLGPFHFTPAAVALAWKVLVTGALDVEALITARFPLEALGDAFRMLDAGGVVKLAIEP